MHCNRREPCPFLGSGLLPEMRVGITLDLGLFHTSFSSIIVTLPVLVSDLFSRQVEAVEKAIIVVHLLKRSVL